jgi:1-acyl-sn-glycerol-3-phosphate acyltransferase
LLFQLLKIPAKIAIRIYCRQVSINYPLLLKSKGPLIIAANHPNSFLDTVILATIFEQPIYSLARGDAFGNKITDSVLKSLNMLPVYRLSEGAGNISNNYTTFNTCQQLFNQNGIVLIFSEGLCINEWHLRPLKKGTARLALTAWKNNVPVTILPVAINYDSFGRFGKNVQLNFGEPIIQNNFDLSQPEGKNVAKFNTMLQRELQKGVYEIDLGDVATRKELFYKPLSIEKKVFLFLPALAGLLLHYPLYFFIKQLLLSKAKGSDHFDSLIVALLFIAYPFYLLLVCLLLFFYIGIGWALWALIVLPILAICTVKMKPQL